MLTILIIWKQHTSPMKKNKKKNRRDGITLRKTNKTGDVRITQQWGAFVLSLLPWKSNKYWYSECVCSLSCLTSKRMRRFVSSSVTYLSVPNISTLSLKRSDFREKVIDHKMCFSIFSTNFGWNISHYRKNCARYYHRCA